MTKKSEWQIKADKEQAMREKGLAGLTSEQLNTIKEAEKTIGTCLDMLFECQDLYLSDMHKLNNVYWAIKNQFNLEK